MIATLPIPAINEMNPGDILAIDTINSTYYVELDEPSEYRGQAIGGHFPDFTEVEVVGSDNGLTFNLGRIVPGLPLVFGIGDHSVTTSPVRRLLRNNSTVFDIT